MFEFIKLQIGITNFIIYLIIINIIAFFMMLIDKRKAEKGKWRIKESTLLMFALLGGCIGEFIGIYVWHHKTQKVKFVIGIPVILLLQLLVLFTL